MNKNSHFDMVIAAIEFIESNLKEPINVQGICKVSPLSPWQFQRIFRAHVGDSMGNYLRGRRMTQAVQHLQRDTTEARIIDVALEFQFSSHEAFSRACKDIFAVSPTELRDLPKDRLIHARPKLDQSKLALIHAGISKKPELKTFGPKKFAGLPLLISSPLGIEAESNGIVSGHWACFDSRREEISNRIAGYSYGFAFGAKDNISDESLTYLAAVEVRTLKSLPAGMQLLEVAEERFAVFEVRGFLDCCNVTTDYIYGIWFPQTDFIRGQGPDFELFDHKIFRRGDEKSISYYFVPVK
jgi:AraC family transcriptional regulator